MRLADIPKGHRAIKRVSIPLLNVGDAPDPEALATKHRAGDAKEHTAEVGVRALRDDEYDLVLARARAHAAERGVQNPGEYDPVYRHALALFTCAIACVDPDSDPRSPAHFFGPAEGWSIDKAAQEIQTSEHVGRDVLAYLYEAQELWQSSVNPRAQRLSPEDMLVQIDRMGRGDLSEAQRFFLASSPGLVVSSLHFMASLLKLLPTSKQDIGSSSLENTPPSSSE